MIERIGSSDIYVKNYTNNFDIKEYIQNIVVPQAFPNLEVNKMNLGLVGITSEMISNCIEDSFGTASMMMNESFITRSQLPSSIYNEASLYNLGMNFAKPARCNIMVQLWLEDVIKYSKALGNSTIRRYKLDKDTKVIIGDNIYQFDYDIFIDHQYMDGQLIVSVTYDIDDNPISNVESKYINHQVTSIGWLLLFVHLQAYERSTETHTITDNLITVNDDIELSWRNQIAGIKLVYISPHGERSTMVLKPQYTPPSIEPFVWYSFKNDNTLRISFSNKSKYFQPEFNSKIESTIYTCYGSASNFSSYNSKIGLPVKKSGNRFEYNASTRIVALCYSESKGGEDRGTLEDLRKDVIVAHNTVNAISTDRDLQLWFDRFGRTEGVYSKFIKRKDDLSGRLFSQFITINNQSYIFPTNTLDTLVKEEDCDFHEGDEYVILPGHVWQYNGDSRSELIMLKDVNDKPVFIADDNLPSIDCMMANPFCIKINKSQSLSVSYNTLLNYTTYPQLIYTNNDVFYKFQLATMSIVRDLNEYRNQYRIETICVPAVTSTLNINYIEGIGDGFPVVDNYLRIVLVFKSKKYGETGFIEMKPINIRNRTNVEFGISVFVKDNLRSDGTIEVDKDATFGAQSLIFSGPHKNRILIDINETQFDFIVLMKDITNKTNSTLYDIPSLNGYIVTDRFTNERRNLSLYEEMGMMRSTVSFTTDGYVKATMMPFIKHTTALDKTTLLYFNNKFREVYKKMIPVIPDMVGNSSLDFKVFNTYGRSNNYYIGPPDNGGELWDSDTKLDNVQLKIRLKISVKDRSIYGQTVDAIKGHIRQYVLSLATKEDKNLHASDIIHLIKNTQPNVNYVRFLGFNSYDANKQSIFQKFDINSIDIRTYVPEIIRVDADDIEISEEV